MLVILKLLPLLRNNWKIVAFILAVIVIYGFGYRNGAAHSSQKYKDIINAQEKNYIREIAAIQENANLKATEYELTRSKNETTLNQIKKRLRDETAKNPDFNNCHAGTEFLRLYGTISGPINSNRIPAR